MYLLLGYLTSPSGRPIEEGVHRLVLSLIKGPPHQGPPSSRAPQTPKPPNASPILKQGDEPYIHP